MTVPTRPNARYGWKPDRLDLRDRVRVADPATLANLPASVDLSTDPHMPPIYDQQQIESCTANGIAAAFEYALRTENLIDFMPSRLFIYYNERSMEGDVDSDAGAQIRDGIKSVAQQGVVPETEWPYDGDPANSDGSWPAGHLAAQQPPASLYAEATHAEAIEYERVVQQADQIKSALAEGLPVVFGFTVYSSFESEQVAQTGDAPMPGPDEQQVGGHCVVAVGYDDAAQRFLCRNSWGTGWGKAGYFTLPYAYLTDDQLSSDFWTLKKVTEAAPSPTPQPAPSPGPAPDPVPTPAPDTDPVDLALVSVAGPWANDEHLTHGARTVARAIKTWRAAKHL